MDVHPVQPVHLGHAAAGTRETFSSRPAPQGKGLATASRRAIETITLTVDSFIRADNSFIGTARSFIHTDTSCIGVADSFIRADKSDSGATCSFIGTDISFIGTDKSFIRIGKSSSRSHFLQKQAENTRKW